MAPGPSAAAPGWAVLAGMLRRRGPKGATLGGWGSGEKGRAGGSTHCGSSPPSLVAGLGPWKPSSPRAGGELGQPALLQPELLPSPAFKKTKPTTTRHQGTLPSRSGPQPDPQRSTRAAGFTVPCSGPPARSSSRHFCRAALSLFGHFLTRVSGPWGQARTNQAPCHPKPTARQRGEPPRRSGTACPTLAP